MSSLTTGTEPVLTHFAGRAGDHNDRGMVGSRILAEALGERLGLQPVTIGVPRPALSVGWQEELAVAMADFTVLSDHCHRLMAAGRWPVTALGRCATALATLPAVAAHRRDAVVVWFDAHADLNTPQNTTTGYLGGLAFSGPLGFWDSGLGAGLSTGNAILVGARDLDPAEQDVIDAGTVTLVGPGPQMPTALAAAIADRPVYVHLDCDVLEPGIVPTDYLVPGGLTLTDLRRAAEVLACNEVVGLEIGELEAGTDAGQARTVTGALLDALGPLLPAPGPH